ncbi:MAG: S41 family peptidase, partial [Chlorobi bacterium]|nr:S41 family peptidase [Chlorobiota bacterium]
LGIPLQKIISGDDIYSQIKKFNFVLQTANKNYVEETDNHKLVEAAIKGMLDELDPHSVYIPPKKLKKVKEDFRGNFDGIGVQFNVFEDTITVISPIAGGPSEALGIQSGDKIVKIDGKNAVGIGRDEIPKRLKGPKGTTVNVEIKREDEADLLSFDIVRDKIPIYSVDAAFMLDDTDIGFISINRFMRTTHVEFLDSVAVLKKKGMRNIILDLRGNPGGFLGQAFRIADEFIPDGHKIVFTKGRKAKFDQDFLSHPGGILENMPVIVLIDAGSASASEILSGAIQDLDRGLVIGETSFGKGLVQRQFEIGDGSAFRLTTSKYYTPSGRCIQRPYEDEKQYRNFAGRLEMKEGMNMNHEIEVLRNDLPADSIPPIFKSLGGRNLLGSGGITPDYVVKYDTITVLSRKIRRANILFKFALNYMNENGDGLKEKYKTNFKSYYRNFELDDDAVEMLKSMAKAKKIEWDDEDFEKDEEYLKISLKAAIARTIWGNNEYRAIFSDLSRQTIKAAELFPEAKQIAKLN